MFEGLEKKEIKIQILTSLISNIFDNFYSLPVIKIINFILVIKKFGTTFNFQIERKMNQFLKQNRSLISGTAFGVMMLSAAFMSTANAAGVENMKGPFALTKPASAQYTMGVAYREANDLCVSKFGSDWGAMITGFHNKTHDDMTVSLYVCMK